MFKNMLNKKYAEYHIEINEVAEKIMEFIESKLKYQFLYKNFTLKLELKIDMSVKPFEISETLKKFERNVVAKDIYDALLKINPNLKINAPESGYILTITRPAFIQFLKNQDMLETYYKLPPLTDEQLNDNELIDLMIRAFEYIIKAASNGANKIFMPISMDENTVKIICNLAELQYEKSVIDDEDAYVVSGWANLE